MEALNRMVEEQKERKAQKAREKAEKMAYLAKREKERQEAEERPPAPVLYSWPLVYKRLQRQSLKPGHLVQRKWLRKGKEKGYVSVPFLSAVKHVIPEPGVDICVVSRREKLEVVTKLWRAEVDDLPLFDIRGVAKVPDDLDPLEPPWETPLDEPLPDDAEVRATARLPGQIESMSQRFTRDSEELLYRVSKYSESKEATVLRKIVAGLPEELLTEDYRVGVRQTVVEILKLLWSVHVASGAVKMRWRLACTDGDPEEDAPEPLGLRAYLMLAGDGLDFVPSQFVDRARVQATRLLSVEQLRRMEPMDWATSVAAKGTNVTEALKSVPPGWTVFLKGDKWPDTKGQGAVHQLSKTGKRLFIQVDFLEGPTKQLAAAGSEEPGAEESAEAQAEPEAAGGFSWMGPLAGFAVAAAAAVRRSPPFTFGQQRRREVDEVLRALQRVPEQNLETDQAFSGFEQRLWMDFGDADEAPVVLVVGSQGETGRVISRKLVTSGYHVVLLKTDEGVTNPERKQKLLAQGAVLTSASAAFTDEPTSNSNITDDLYDAVAGIDKLVICACDNETSKAAERLSGQIVKNVLACWQIYRYEFAERQRSYSSKVQLFNFSRETDFELWGVERQRPSDLSYGNQRVGWTVNSDEKALFLGQFFEDYCQAALKSPKLKLNFRRFSGLMIKVYNQAVSNTYSWFLRTSDFEETRLQYEYTFECNASSWHTVRMPFNAFKLVRADGVQVPKEEADQRPLRREDVVQIGIVVRTNGVLRPPDDRGRLNYFSLAIDYLKVFRTQAEPQVVFLGRDEDSGAFAQNQAEEAAEKEDEAVTEAKVNEELDRVQAEERAAAEIDELVSPPPKEVSDTDDDLEVELSSSKASPMQAVVESGLAYTIIKVNGLNEHPGGKFPVCVRQAPLLEPPLSTNESDLGSISRGDAAELVVSALTEPACVNTELAAGEPARGEEGKARVEGDLLTPTFEIGSTMNEDVKAYLRQLTPNR